MFKIYHNPRCSKSRETLKILTDKGVEVEVKEYLKETLSLDELETIYRKLGLPLDAMVRTKEDIFPSLNLNMSDSKSVFKAILENPILLERPIVLKGEKAVIGRPPENVRVLLD